MIRLKTLRTEKGLSQKEVSEYLGISQPAYANYERQARQADYETLKKLSTLFGVSIDYLLGREEKPSEKTDDLSDKIIEMFSHLDKSQQQKVIEYTQFVLSLDDDKQC